MIQIFVVSLDKTIRRKVWELETLPTTMMKLLDIVIHLGDAQEFGQLKIPNIKMSFGKKFKDMKHKFHKPKYVAKKC